jgi:hypothetical protein
MSLNAETKQKAKITASQSVHIKTRPIKLPERLTDQEKASHAILVRELGDDSLWIN